MVGSGLTTPGARTPSPPPGVFGELPGICCHFLSLRRRERSHCAAHLSRPGEQSTTSHQSPPCPAGGRPARPRLPRSDSGRGPLLFASPCPPLERLPFHLPDSIQFSSQTLIRKTPFTRSSGLCSKRTSAGRRPPYESAPQSLYIPLPEFFFSSEQYNYLFCSLCVALF